MKTKSNHPNPVQHSHAFAFVFGTVGIAFMMLYGITLG